MFFVVTLIITIRLAVDLLPTQQIGTDKTAVCTGRSDDDLNLKDNLSARVF